MVTILTCNLPITKWYNLTKYLRRLFSVKSLNAEEAEVGGSVSLRPAWFTRQPGLQGYRARPFLKNNVRFWACKMARLTKGPVEKAWPGFTTWSPQWKVIQLLRVVLCPHNTCLSVKICRMNLTTTYCPQLDRLILQFDVPSCRITPKISK